MPKQKIEIEVDVPEGKEAFIKWTGRSEQPIELGIRDAWQWPLFLNADWIAMDSDGKWFAYQGCEPREGQHNWMVDSSYKLAREGKLMCLSMLSIAPPPCTDWRQSKRRRPTNA